MTCIFAEVVDYAGRTISIDAITIALVFDFHDEVAGRMDDIIETISKPDAVAETDNEILALKKFGNDYIVVIYSLFGKKGRLVTSFATKRVDEILKRRDLKWLRK